VTKNSPVYHDTKFVNKRAGKPPATVEEAKVSIRTFENSPRLALEQKQKMTTPRGEVYEMASDNGRYFVNAQTGEVELASFYNKQKPPGQNLFMSKTAVASSQQSSDAVTMDQAFAIAEDYAGKNYPNFYNRTMVLTQTQLVDHGAGGKTYYFTWMENVNGVVIPNGVAVTVNADTGDVLSYIGIGQPVSVDIVPSISRDAAIAKAVSAFSPITVVKSDTHLTVVSLNGTTQNLGWAVDILGAPKDHIEQGGQVMVDAHSGEVLMVNRFA
jgi:hypothetical protein